MWQLVKDNQLYRFKTSSQTYNINDDDYDDDDDDVNHKQNIIYITFHSYNSFYK